MKQAVFEFEDKTDFAEENFLISDCNQEAYQLVRNCNEWNFPIALIYGDAGSGKTYLAHICQQRSNGAFLNNSDIARIVQDGSIKQDDFFVFEDIQNFSDERQLLHFLNLLKERKAQLLLTSEKHPSHLGITLPDLKSRICSYPAVKIKMPDDELFYAILIRLFAEKRVTIAEEVVDYLVMRLERSFEAARKAVNAINNKSLSEKRGITIPLARDVIESGEISFG